MAENQHIEYKQSWHDEYLKWVCGFANAEGGLLVIGRIDRGDVVGIANADRLLIWNPGELPENWSEAKLLGPHPSQPYNPDVANAFFRAGEIEAWGRGIERVFDACREAGTPESRIRVEMGGLWFEFPFSADYLASISGERDWRGTSETTQETRGKTREKTREKILALIRQHPSITTMELAEQIGITAKGIEWQLNKLKAAGWIRRVGPAKGGHWEVIGGPDE